MEKTKVYKPEISFCPLCHSKLKYRYTVSNKVITFTNGKDRRIKNLGYSCTNPNCLDNSVIYTSQTAVKLCIKGYTYSSKILAEIAIMKHRHMSREQICNRLALSGIEISDRNIDIINLKYDKYVSSNYHKRILTEYENMNNKYQQVRISIDCLRFDGDRIITIRNSFTNDIIGIHIINRDNLERQKEVLKEYINHPEVKEITTTRPMTDFFQLVKSLLDHDVLFYHYEKF